MLSSRAIIFKKFVVWYLDSMSDIRLIIFHSLQRKVYNCSMIRFYSKSYIDSVKDVSGNSDLAFDIHKVANVISN